MRRAPRLVTVVLGIALAASACSIEEPEPVPMGGGDEATEKLALPAEAPTDPRQALALVPEDARRVTITNYTALGDGSVRLAEGLLQPHQGRLSSDYGFGRGDVTFELTFAGGGAEGYVLGLRPALDLGPVRRAVRDGVGPLAGAEVRPEQHLVVSGTAAEGDPVWTDDEDLVHLTSAQDETTYLQQGCLAPQRTFDALPGRAAQRLRQSTELQQVRPLEAFSISFSGAVATGRLGLERIDLTARTDLTEAWPEGGTAFGDGYTGMPLFDSSTGRVGLRVQDPVAAARAVRQGQLPFAVCAPDDAGE